MGFAAHIVSLRFKKANEELLHVRWTIHFDNICKALTIQWRSGTVTRTPCTIELTCALWAEYRASLALRSPVFARIAKFNDFIAVVPIHGRCTGTLQGFVNEPVHETLHMGLAAHIVSLLLKKADEELLHVHRTFRFDNIYKALTIQWRSGTITPARYRELCSERRQHLRLESRSLKH
jgi:hypothetical protein